MHSTEVKTFFGKGIDAEINNHAKKIKKEILSVNISHGYHGDLTAMVVFGLTHLACEAPDELPIMIRALKEPVETITIPLSDIKQDSFDKGGFIRVTVNHDGMPYIAYGDTTHTAVANLIKNIEIETGCRVLVNCGSNGKQDASFFMKRHDKLVADRSKH